LGTAGGVLSDARAFLISSVPLRGGVRSMPPRGTRGRPQLPSMRRASSRQCEVPRWRTASAAATCNVPAVPRRTRPRSRPRGQDVEGRGSHAAIG
jgi:hypothetical protein